MLWIQALVFTVLVPGLVGVWVPFQMAGDQARIHGGVWSVGWLLVGTGVAIYLACLRRFLASGGTPAIYLTPPVKLLLGDEPPRLVHEGLYRRSRNPMYISVVLTVLGQAMLFASRDVAVYGLVLWLLYHLGVVFFEEPHLRRRHGQAYIDYCRRVPRWFGFGSR